MSLSTQALNSQALNAQSPSNLGDIDGALSQFGLSEFRPGQREVISQVVAGHDCLCVMPTGGGKSLCYQLPTVVRPGLTIVVSPLIALMKDQVDALGQRGIPATLINSSLSHSEQQTRLQQVTEGKFRLVYVAPERLRNQRFIEAIRATPIQLLAIDEAHCISQWGHDFRPDYARLGKFREWLGNVQTIALTATATTRVRQDIVDVLRLKNAKQFINGFARTNLHLGVVPCQSERDKLQELKQFFERKPGSGIVYAATRKKCEELVQVLADELKISVGTYHAGLLPDQRRAIQDRFMSGQIEVIVATNAFGMGIDKADLRFVIHYNMPGSLEAYYQEAGRAGRDGLPSQCVLLYSYQDRFVQEFFIENAHPSRDIVRKVYEFLLDREEDPIELTQQEIKDLLELPVSGEAVSTSLQLLSRTGVVDRLEAGSGMAIIRISSDLPTLVDVLPREAKSQRKVLRLLEKAVGDRRYEQVFVHPRWLLQESEMEREALQRALREVTRLESVEYIPPFRGKAIHVRQRDIPFDKLEIDFEQLKERKRAEFDKLDQVISFAQARRCRQLTILDYFGDPHAKQCHGCDRCQGKVGWPDVPHVPGAKVDPNAKKKSSADSRTTEQAPPILQDVLRAIASLHGRLGKQLVAQHLCGSQNAKVQRLRLQRLASFGMLSMLQQTQASKLLDALLASGLIGQQEVNAHRPTIFVTPVGEAVLQGSQPWPDLTLPKTIMAKLASLTPAAPAVVPRVAEAPPSRPVATASKPSEGRTLGELPNQVAASVPSVVASVAAPVGGATPGKGVVNAAASSAPAPPSVVQANAGTAPAVAQGVLDFGGNREKSDSQKSETVSSSGEKSGKLGVVESTPAKPEWYWTWRLLQDGYSWEHVGLIRRKETDQLCDDLRQALAAGRPLQPKWFRGGASRVGSSADFPLADVNPGSFWPDWLPEDLRKAMTAEGR